MAETGVSREWIGLDLGGSAIKAVRTDTAGRVLARHEAEAGGRIARRQLFDLTRRALAAVSTGERARTVGMAFGGAIQADGTMRATSTNLPNLAGLPLQACFEDELGASVRIEHDARAAMRGEAWSGAAHHVGNAMAITLGTGIGAGIMIERRIVSGAHGRAGEIGVWKLDAAAPDGSWPTFEQCSAPGSIEPLTGKSFATMFADGAADAIIARTGRAIANAHLLLDLDMAILLGGVTRLGEPLRHAIELAFRAACQDDYHPGFVVALGAHGTFAGAVGAASLWQEDAL